MLPIRRKPSPEAKDIEIDLQTHGIVMVIPAGAIMNGTLRVAGGVLILGYFKGEIYSTRGSVIVASGAHFLGLIQAQNIIVEGRVGDVAKSPQDSASLEARLRVALSEHADVHAVIQAPKLHLPEGAEMRQSVVKIMTPVHRKVA